MMISGKTSEGRRGGVDLLDECDDNAIGLISLVSVLVLMAPSHSLARNMETGRTDERTEYRIWNRL